MGLPFSQVQVMTILQCGGILRGSQENLLASVDPVNSSTESRKISNGRFLVASFNSSFERISCYITHLSIHYLEVRSDGNSVIGNVLKRQHVCIADLHTDRPGNILIDILSEIYKDQKCDSLVTEIQDQLEQGAKSRGVWGGAAESDHEQRLGRGQPFLDIDLNINKA